MVQTNNPDSDSGGGGELRIGNYELRIAMQQVKIKKILKS